MTSRPATVFGTMAFDILFLLPCVVVTWDQLLASPEDRLVLRGIVHTQLPMVFLCLGFISLAGHAVTRRLARKADEEAPNAPKSPTLQQGQPGPEPAAQEESV